MSPIVYDTVPNFGKDALPRRYAFVVDEAGGTADMAPCPGGVRTGSYMLDITNESRPFPVSVWQVPVGDFCTKGGHFGPHQSADTVNGKINRFENKIAWLAYFNAGIRVSTCRSVSDEGTGLLHSEDQREITSDRDGPADGDPDQRRGHRLTWVRLRFGPGWNRLVHPGVHEAELTLLSAFVSRRTEALTQSSRVLVGGRGRCSRERGLRSYSCDPRRLELLIRGDIRCAASMRPAVVKSRRLGRRHEQAS